jgi:hypothetical protein
MQQYPSNYQPPSQWPTDQPQPAPTAEEMARWQQQRQPMYQPPPQVQVNVQTGTPKKRSRALLIIFGAMLFIFGYIVGTATSSHDTTTTASVQTTPGTSATRVQTMPTATHTAIWTTTQTFSGNGNSKTAIFPVGSDWKIAWKCDPASFVGNSYNLIVSVTGSDNTTVDPATINTICQNGNTSGSTEEHQAGSVFLDVGSEGTWTITVSEPK